MADDFTLGPNRYGKSAVRVFKVHGAGVGVGVSDLTVQIACEGDFAAVHAHGDNSPVVATDTMKNTVYAMAQDRLGPEIERFARVLVAHFLEFPQISGVRVEIEERPWTTIGAHRHAFTPAGAERRLARITAGTMGDRVEAGIRELIVLKTAGSSFAGFPRDRYTTLPDADDRILATAVTAEWRYRGHPDDYSATWHRVRTALVESFASEPSRSVQEQGYLMGGAVLRAEAEVDEITLGLPNRHHLQVDLSRFGMDDRGVVFQPVDEPYGDIWVTVRRHEPEGTPGV
ncbi:MAG: factor-independent urate hydroxylase [Acidimicrobiales bacterium]